MVYEYYKLKAEVNSEGLSHATWDCLNGIQSVFQ